MKDRVSPDIVRMCERWSGGQRLRDVVCSFGEQSPATHVGNLARFLLARPSLRERHCARLLLDAVLLARLVGSDGSAVALVKGVAAAAAAAEPKDRRGTRDWWRRSRHHRVASRACAREAAKSFQVIPSHPKSSQVIPSHLSFRPILMGFCACHQCLRR